MMIINNGIHAPIFLGHSQIILLDDKTRKITRLNTFFFLPFIFHRSTKDKA